MLTITFAHVLSFGGGALVTWLLQSYIRDHKTYNPDDSNVCPTCKGPV